MSEQTNPLLDTYCKVHQLPHDPALVHLLGDDLTLAYQSVFDEPLPDIPELSNFIHRWNVRDDCVGRYSWAIPNEPAIACLRDHTPVLELGAGTGYWAGLVAKAGGYVRCYDKKPNGVWWSVLEGRARKARKFPDHALFLCWPPYNNAFASDALTYYTGETCIYIGEGCGGCTGDDYFHELLLADWIETDSIPIPQWYGIHDRMFVFRRK